MEREYRIGDRISFRFNNRIVRGMIQHRYIKANGEEHFDIKVLNKIRITGYGLPTARRIMFIRYNPLTKQVLNTVGVWEGVTEEVF